MRIILVIVAALLVVGLIVVAGVVFVPGETEQGPAADNKSFDLNVEPVVRDTEGGRAIVTVTFKPVRKDRDDPHDFSEGYKYVILEQGKVMVEKPLPRNTKSEAPSVYLALDVSHAMAKGTRMDEVRKASNVFLNKLPTKAEAGLIFFNDKVAVKEQLSQDRDPLREDIKEVRPEGGNAYRDATAKAVEQLAEAKGKRVAVILTNGRDLNSEKPLHEVIDLAKAQGVQVYTVGIGEPSKDERVTSVMVLDISGSMNEPANDTGTTTKITDLRRAATRFLDFIPQTDMQRSVRTTVLAFSDVPLPPGPFTSSRTQLEKTIRGLKAKGETALFDAIYEAIMALEADGQSGKRAIIAMTDGIDNSSRRRSDEVIARAREAKIPLYLLGFGREGELDACVMQKLAKETALDKEMGGKSHFFHAKTQKELFAFFQELSLILHEDGINVGELTKLAKSTGGKYLPARNIQDLEEVFRKVIKNVQTDKIVEAFPSNFADTGTQIPVRVDLVRLDDSKSVASTETTYQTRGLVIADINHFVYLGLLAVIGSLIVVPAGLRRMTRPQS
jgi:VWFA-related protein